MDQLTVENISERVTHVETCVQPHWMFFTTAGQLQKEQLGVTAANDACDTIPQLVMTMKNTLSIDDALETEQISDLLSIEDGFGGIEVSVKTFKVDPSEG